MADNEASQGVIHDIGFRHYDGVRLGRGWIVRSLLVETFRGVFGLGRPAKAKIMPWVLIGILFAPPLVFALIAVILGLDTLPLSYTAFPQAMQLVVSLFVASPSSTAMRAKISGGVNRMPMSTHGMILAFAGRPRPNTPLNVSTSSDPVSYTHLTLPTNREV